MTANKSANGMSNIPGWSWVTAALGLLLVGGTVGFMLYRGLSNGPAVPDIAIAVESVIPRDGRYLVAIVVSNDGSGTAHQLVVEGSLTANGTAMETSAVTIDYVAAGSRRRAGLYFTRDPRLSELHLHARSHVQP